VEVADIEVGFEYGAGDGATEREIIRNVEMIMATPVGSSPLYRDFGVDNSMLDKPLDVARSLYAVAVMEAVDRWEPRARAEQVTLTPEASGKLRAKAVIVLA
jgi:phage baseplate assembly protein W